LRKADSAYRQGALTEALLEYKEATLADPRSTQAYFQQGQIYFQKGRLSSALFFFRRVVELNPGDGEARYYLARVAVNQGDLGEAEKQLSWLVESSQRKIDAELLLGEIAWKKGDLDEAKARWQAVIEQNDKHLEARYYVALTLAPVKPEEAKAEFSHLVSRAHGDLADKAKTMYQTILKSQAASQLTGSRVLLADGYIKVEEYEAAIRLLEATKDQAMGDQRVHLFLGYAYLLDGQAEKGLREEKEAVRLSPQDFEGHYFMGLADQKLGNSSLAVEEFKAALSLAPKEVPIYLSLAESYISLGDYDAAEAAMKQARQLDPQNYDLIERLARFYLDRGYKVESALPLVRELVKLQPSSARSHQLAGWAFLRNGDYQQAEGELNLALKLDPSSAATYFYWANLKQQAGQTALAIEAYRRVLDLDSSGEYLSRSVEALRSLGYTAELPW